MYLKKLRLLHCPNLHHNFTCFKLKGTSFSTSIMAKSTSHKQKGAHLPTWTGGATKWNCTANSSFAVAADVDGDEEEFDDGWDAIPK